MAVILHHRVNNWPYFAKLIGAVNATRDVDKNIEIMIHTS